MLALLKIARIASGHAKEDNWIDLAGYAACGGEIETETDAVEQVEEIDLAGVIDWQDAIRVMRSTCIEADECGPGCPMNEWCQAFNKDGSAPAKWEPIENEEAEE
jgi:hypothetical protein